MTEQKRNEFLEKLNRCIVKPTKPEKISVGNFMTNFFSKAGGAKVLDKNDFEKKFVLQPNNAANNSKPSTKSLASITNYINVTLVDYDIPYTLNNFTAGNLVGFALNTDGIKKLTSYVCFDQPTDFVVGIANTDAEGYINILEQHSSTLGSTDIDTYFTNGGYYYVLIQVFSGGGTCQLQFTKSTSVSAVEPNDVPSPLKTIYTDIAQVSDTFDNINDYDFIHYKLTKPTQVFFQLYFPVYLAEYSNINTIFDFGFYQIADANGNALSSTTINQRKLHYTSNGLAMSCDNTPTLPAGEYYFFLAPTANVPDLFNIEYRFTLSPISQNTPFPSYVYATNITNSVPECHGHYGSIPLVKMSADITANVENGNSYTLLPNVPIVCRIKGIQQPHQSRGDYEQITYGISNSEGVFYTKSGLPYVYKGEVPVMGGGDLDTIEFYAYSYNKDTNKFGFKETAPSVNSTPNLIIVVL